MRALQKGAGDTLRAPDRRTTVLGCRFRMRVGKAAGVETYGFTVGVFGAIQPTIVFANGGQVAVNKLLATDTAGAFSFELAGLVQFNGAEFVHVRIASCPAISLAWNGSALLYRQLGVVEIREALKTHLGRDLAVRITTTLAAHPETS